MPLFTIVFWIISLVLVSWVWCHSDKLSSRTRQLTLLLAAIGFIIGTSLYQTNFQALTLIEETGETNYNVLVSLNSQAIGDKIRVIAGAPTPIGSSNQHSTFQPQESSVKTYLVNLPTLLNDSSLQVRVNLEGDMCHSSGVSTFDCSTQTSIEVARNFVVTSSIANVASPTGDTLTTLGTMIDHSNATPIPIATVSRLGSNKLVVTVDPGTAMFSGTLGCQLITTSPTDGLVVIQDISDRHQGDVGYTGDLGSACLNSRITKSISINGARLKNRAL